MYSIKPINRIRKGQKRKSGVDPNDKTAKLELKQKQGNVQLKRSLEISREHAIRLINRDYSPLLLYDEPFAAEMYGLMTMPLNFIKTTGYKILAVFNFI